MNRAAIQHGQAERRVSPNGVGITEPLRLLHAPMLRDKTMLVPINDIDQRIAGFAESSSCARDSAEGGLNVSRRSGGYGERSSGLLLDHLARGRVNAGVQRTWPRIFFDRYEGGPTFQANLRLRRVLLLAPEAFHAHSPRAGRGSGLATIARGRGRVK
jgi:hypothetical protein